MGKKLDIYPAWGFDTESRWEVAAAQRDKSLTKQGKGLSKAYHRKDGASMRCLNNIAKVASYFPLLNIMTGIWRIVLNTNNYAWTDDQAKLAIAKRHVKRGVADLLAGPFMIIPDLIQTCKDRKAVKNYLQKHPELKA